VAQDLVEAILLSLKISRGWTKVVNLFLLLAAEALLVLQLPFEAGILGQRFLELNVQLLHHNSVALLHPLKR
jgi:hypothetical protein